MKRRVLRAVFWQGGTSILARGTRYIAVLILGRLLSPTDFGTFASLYVLVEGLFLVAGMGLGEAVIVNREHEAETADAVFLLSAGLGIASFAVAWIAAPAVESFYRLDHGAGVFRALASVLVIHGLRVVPMRLLEKAFDFRAKVIPTLLGAIAYLVISVALAARGRAVWSFVIALLVASLVEMIAFWIKSPWRPRFRWDPAIARRVLAFGLPVVLGSVGIYLFGSVDRVVLARWGGPEMLGPYAFAFSLASLPATLGAAIVGGVLLPSYGLLADDAERRLSLHLRAAGVIAGAAVLFAALGFLLSRDALTLAYGEKWDAAVPVLQVLVLGSVFRSLVSLVGDFLVGVGNPRGFQRMNVLQLGIAVVAVPLALPRAGVVGVAVAMSLASAVALVYGWVMASSAVHAPFLRFASCLATPLRAGVAGTLGILGARMVASSTGALAVAGAAIAGTLAFSIAWWLLDAPLRQDVYRLLRRGSDG